MNLSVAGTCGYVDSLSGRVQHPLPLKAGFRDCGTESQLLPATADLEGVSIGEHDSANRLEMV